MTISLNIFDTSIPRVIYATTCHITTQTAQVEKGQHRAKGVGLWLFDNFAFFDRVLFNALIAKQRLEFVDLTSLVVLYMTSTNRIQFRSTGLILH